MTGPVTGIRRRRGVAGRRETPHLPLDRDFYGQTLGKYEGEFNDAMLRKMWNISDDEWDFIDSKIYNTEGANK